MIQKNFTVYRDVKHKLKSWNLQIQKRGPKDRQSLQRNHHLQALVGINFNHFRWEHNRSRSAIRELCTPNIIDLPILNLTEIGRSFEIKTSTIRMVQHSPFIGKEDPNLHLQAFIQLCQTFNMDGVTQNQMRARLFPFSLLGKALQWFYTQLA
jgi:hypothetical protein